MAVLDMILSIFLSTFCIHHANAGSSVIWLSTVYSASCTGKDSLTSLTCFQVEPPSFHCMRTSHPLVVSLLLLLPLDIWIKESPSLICVPLVQKSIMTLNNKKLCPCWSTWENKLLDIALDDIAILYPPAYQLRTSLCLGLYYLLQFLSVYHLSPLIYC